MRRIQITVVIIGLLLFSFNAGAEDKQTPKMMNKVEPLPRDLEIQLALIRSPKSFARQIPSCEVQMDIQPLHTKIDKTIQTTYGTIVLEDPTGFPRSETNRYCVSANGKIAWKAEKPDPYTLYSRVRLSGDGSALSTYTLSGHACDVELGTGKILSKTGIQ